MDSASRIREIEVAAGLVFREGRILVAQRRAGDTLGGYWEFPGGKRHAHESFEGCLGRELAEELGIEVAVGELFESVDHRYPEALVHLRFYLCRWLGREPRALGCADFAWITREQLGDYRFPPADAGLLRRLAADAALWGTAGREAAC